MTASGQGVRHFAVKATNIKTDEVQILQGQNQVQLALKFQTNATYISEVLSGRGDKHTGYLNNLFGDWRLVVLNRDLEPEPSAAIQNGYLPWAPEDREERQRLAQEFHDRRVAPEFPGIGYRLTTEPPTTPLKEVMDKTVLEFARLVFEIPEGQALTSSQHSFATAARLVLDGQYQWEKCTTFDNAVLVPSTLAGKKVYMKLYRLVSRGVVYGGEELWHLPYAFGVSADLQRKPKQQVQPRGTLLYTCKTDLDGKIIEFNGSDNQREAAKHYGKHEGKFGAVMNGSHPHNQLGKHRYYKCTSMGVVDQSHKWFEKFPFSLV